MAAQPTSHTHLRPIQDHQQLHQHLRHHSPNLLCLSRMAMSGWSAAQCPAGWSTRHRHVIRARHAESPSAQPSALQTGLPMQKAHYGSITEECPQLAEQWDPDLNIDEETGVAVTPGQFTMKSKYRAWWRQPCPACGEYIYWRCCVKDRIKGKVSGSYVLRGSSQICPCSSMPAEYPSLMQEWDWEENRIDPHTCSPGSQKKAWWRCQTCKEKWQAAIATRTKGHGCPECAVRDRGSNWRRRQLLCLERLDLFASIVDAPGVDAVQLTCGNSTVPVVWSCRKCRPPDCTHDRTWTARVSQRLRYGCPYCLNRKVCPCTSLSQVYPEVASEWGMRNVVQPDSVPPHSGMKVWWQCQSSTGSLIEWQATVDSQVKAWVERGCLSRPKKLTGELQGE